MSQVLICGAAGYTNAGDDAILWGMLTQLRGGRQAEACGTRASSELLGQAEACGTRASMGQAKACRTQASMEQAEARGTRSPLAITVAGGPHLRALVEPFEARAISYDDRAELARAIEESDLVILGGGGLLYDVGYDAGLHRLLSDPPDRQWLYEMARIAAVASAAGRPVMLYGMGVGPLVTDAARNVARFICEQAKAITVRDQASAEVLIECGVARSRVYVAADPAIVVKPHPPRPLPANGEGERRAVEELGLTKAPRPWVAINLRPWGDETQRERLVAEGGALARAIREQLGGTAVLLPLQRMHDDDLPLLERVAEASGAGIMRESLLPPQLVGALAQFDVVIGMRLHALVLALAAGKPFVAISYDPKVEEFARRAGLGAYVHAAGEFTADAVVASCRELLKGTGTGTGGGSEPVQLGQAKACGTQASHGDRHRMRPEASPHAAKGTGTDTGGGAEPVPMREELREAAGLSAEVASELLGQAKACGTQRGWQTVSGDRRGSPLRDPGMGDRRGSPLLPTSHGDRHRMRPEASPHAAKGTGTGTGGGAEPVPMQGIRVLMRIRADYRERPGGDTVQMEETKRALERLGVRVDVSGDDGHDLSAYDIVHAFNLGRPEEPQRHCLEAAEQGKPVALSTVYWDFSEFWEWGDPDYWELPPPLDSAQQAEACATPGEGLPVPHPAPPPDPIEARRRARLDQRRRAAIECATVYLPNGQGEAELLYQAYGMDLSRTVVVTNAVDERFFSARPEPFVEKHGLRDFVLCAARVEKRKNQLLLVAALRGTGIPLVIVGQPNPEEYRELCRRYADANVTFLEALPREELASAYAAAKVHALPGWFETPGLSTLEAAAAGCNIVTTDRGTAREYLGDGAWYCDPKDVESIRNAVLAAYTAPRTGELRELVRERYTWARAAESTLEGYRLALALHQRRDDRGRCEQQLGALRAQADFLAKLAADRQYEAQQMRRWAETVEAELKRLQAEFERVTSRRLHRWSSAIAQGGWSVLRAIGVKKR